MRTTTKQLWHINFSKDVVSNHALAREFHIIRDVYAYWGIRWETLLIYRNLSHTLNLEQFGDEFARDFLLHNQR